jgi:hypothetical protein
MSTINLATWQCMVFVVLLECMCTQDSSFLLISILFLAVSGHNCNDYRHVQRRLRAVPFGGRGGKVSQMDTHKLIITMIL